MYIITQNGKSLINLDKFERICVDENDLLVKNGEEYVLLGTYPDEKAAHEVFTKIVDNMADLGIRIEI